MTVRHLLEVDDLTPDELADVLAKAGEPSPPRVLAGRGVALLFEKPSLRTRNATEVAVVHLGGHPLTLRGEEVGLATREPPADVARVLSAYHAAIGARVFSHHALELLAEAATVPVVNLLSDRSHPCQAVADLLTLEACFGKLAGLRVAYVGDFNNVARSLVLAGAMTGMATVVSCPPGYGPGDDDRERVAALGGVLEEAESPKEAADGAHAVYTDVWTSMGQEGEEALRADAFAGFIVDDAVMSAARPDAVFLHCLPAHRGEEVAASVVDGAQSVVWQQAANRMHAVRGLLWFLVEES